MPIATALAGVNMRLKGNAYRELHWHSAGEVLLSVDVTFNSRFSFVISSGDMSLQEVLASMLLTRMEKPMLPKL